MSCWKIAAGFRHDFIFMFSRYCLECVDMIIIYNDIVIFYR
ncbi:hypothetical protein ECH7EC4486_1541 [Escherichia coli O157:H7 str. EC4486]|uniref:Uncharacterized protein n=1 Tax=Escherichia coli TaxID=562 RepID=A0A075M8Y7_ECOLX|nr:hypothetical protein [Escherichia coli]EDU78972.1 hypothetical protein ECH7EC4486_1541 [Escherichia coli O157:H7 str. EC4486]EGB80021.1 hypothetical protein HMPREF9533_05222 [Escherichia coli MS 60-1]EKI32116.1 hypothetical protein ECTW00353_5002 [Escherichia coli TW00353]UVZ00748.1 hypothetical protein [Escherichia coli]